MSMQMANLIFKEICKNTKLLIGSLIPTLLGHIAILFELPNLARLRVLRSFHLCRRTIEFSTKGENPSYNYRFCIQLQALVSHYISLHNPSPTFIILKLVL